MSPIRASPSAPGLLILESLLDARRTADPMRLTMQCMLLANPRGFCAGVDRAIDIVERAIELFGAPIYVRHEVVHNRHVVDRLRAMGARFVEELTMCPMAPPSSSRRMACRRPSRTKARAPRGFQVFDATCPLVTKVHLEVARYARDARDVVLIGHAGHPEVEGTMGRFDASAGGRIHLVESVADVDAAHGARPGDAGLRHADHAVGG